MENTGLNGSYDLEGVIWHQHSSKLMKKILQMWPKEVPVLDIGCGHNFYVSVLNYAGYDAVGCDMVDLQSKPFFIQDVTEEISYSKMVNAFRNLPLKSKINVLSLEVGEHLPTDLMVGYLRNLVRWGGDIILSWAIPGQQGHGHINCKTNLWVADEMYKMGYTLHPMKSNELREAVDGCSCTWFSHTLMYFTPSK